GYVPLYRARHCPCAHASRYSRSVAPTLFPVAGRSQPARPHAHPEIDRPSRKNSPGTSRKPADARNTPAPKCCARPREPATLPQTRHPPANPIRQVRRSNPESAHRHSPREPRRNLVDSGAVYSIQPPPQFFPQRQIDPAFSARVSTTSGAIAAAPHRIPLGRSLLLPPPRCPPPTPASVP